jgi:endonuclease VIII
MPEGHTLHRLAATLEGAFAGSRPQASSPQGRFVEGARRLDGLRLERVDSWGKHLFLTYAEDVILNVHLGLIGRFDVTAHAGPGQVDPPVGAVRLRLVNDTHVADLRGATRVEIVTPEEVDATVGRLGPDPLRAGTPGNEPERAMLRLARSRRTIAECLMDQSVLAGVGNVYRCEILFRHRVDPFRPGGEIRPATFRAVWEDLVALLPLGVAFGQILTMEHQVADAVDLLSQGRGPAVTQGSGGGRSAFPREYYVYQRAGQPCHVCGSRVRTQVLSGRNLFWCGRCQRRR